MLIPKLLFIESLFVVFLVDLFEDIFEAAIVLFKNGVLGAHVKWVVSADCILETAVSKANNRFVSVVHSHKNAGAFKLVCLHFYS